MDVYSIDINSSLIKSQYNVGNKIINAVISLHRMNFITHYMY